MQDKEFKTSFYNSAYQQTNLFAFTVHVAPVLYHESRKPAISHDERTMALTNPF